MSSEIASIVDYTAQVAGRIEGVVSVKAAGLGLTGDPLRTGNPIDVARDAPTTAYEHWSDLPDAPRLEWLTQDGLVRITWDLPMTLWLPAGYAELRRAALPMYGRYLAAFFSDQTLGGLCLLARISKLELEDDVVMATGARWGRLNINLEVQEEVEF